MHFFDIIGAQEGDTFAIGVMAGPNSFGNAGVAGFSFDVLTNVTVDDADFDGNGTVDGADFLIWQRGSGAAGGLNQGDANNDGIVNAARSGNLEGSVWNRRCDRGDWRRSRTGSGDAARHRDLRDRSFPQVTLKSRSTRSAIASR